MVPYAVWREQQIVALSEEQYWQYLGDRRHGRHGRWEADWQEEYEQLRRQEAREPAAGRGAV